MNIRRPAGALEADVLAVLMSGSDAMTAAEVRAAMGESLAYTTVMTVLSRLATKGLVLQESRGRAYAYAAMRDEAEVTAQRMRLLLEAGGDRAAVLARFVGTLSDDDEQLLLDMLANPERDDQP
ncbi:MAG TPA: BlaI/MecI/CopY family transcriptional regulator [Micromonosporaceae bacterium]|jgi:predicted transcriptional regulator